VEDDVGTASEPRWAGGTTVNTGGENTVDEGGVEVRAASREGLPAGDKGGGGNKTGGMCRHLSTHGKLSADVERYPYDLAQQRRFFWN